MSDKDVFICALEMAGELTKEDWLSRDEYGCFADCLDLCLAIAFAFAYGDNWFDNEVSFYQTWSPKARDLDNFRENVERTRGCISYYNKVDKMWPVLIGLLENEAGFAYSINTYEADFINDSEYQEKGEIIKRVISARLWAS